VFEAANRMADHRTMEEVIGSCKTLCGAAGFRVWSKSHERGFAGTKKAQSRDRQEETIQGANVKPGEVRRAGLGSAVSTENW